MDPANFAELDSKVTTLQHQTSESPFRGSFKFGSWVPGGGTGFNISLFPFAYSFSSTNITVAAGEVRRGIRGVINVAATGVTPLSAPVSGTTYYVYVNVVLATDTGTLAIVATTKPTSDATNYKCWLYQVLNTAGVLSLVQIGHLGNIELPGVTA
jgi:hypothetical protein